MNSEAPATSAKAMLPLLPLLFSAFPLMALSSLVDYENPGPRYRSAEDDATFALRVPAIAFGIFDKDLMSYLEYLKSGGSQTTAHVHSSRRQLQAELATFLLSIIDAQGKPLPKDKATMVADALAKSDYKKDVIAALASAHRKTPDKKLSEVMGKNTSVDFAGKFCTSQKAYSNALFTAEMRALSLLKDQELLKKLGMSSQAEEFKHFHMRLLTYVKQIKEAVQIEPSEIFARNPCQEVRDRGNLEYLTDHMKYSLYEAPVNVLKTNKKMAKKAVRKAVAEAGTEVAHDVQDAWTWTKNTADRLLS